MKVALAAVLALHGLIHLMGFAKAFGYAELPQLTRGVSRPMGALWLLVALLFLAAAAALFAWPRGWWWLGAPALVASQLAIVSSWTDARYGTLANLVALVAVLHGFLSAGPTSFHAQYRRDVAALLPRTAPGAILAEADLAPLPAPVRRYLRATGNVGKPRVNGFRVSFRGRIRSAAEARWMPFTSEQHNATSPRARLFFMEATMLGVPADGYHRFQDDAATMRVRIASLLTAVDAAGPEMTRGETVTLFNDMCVMAPAMLVDPAIAWEPVDERTARAAFTHAGNTIRAELSFDAEGLLADFASDDRLRSSADGKSFTRMRWSTPLRDYRTFEGRRVSTRADILWHDPAGKFAYGEFELVEITWAPSR
jgi:hypothetical protein